ncbi:hypothetical protein TrST_g8568 [Triparma strigata]|uniref:Carbohydrate-binding domain-containing protein n=1 Tax=Triparma strigata TaxID=1606541 RepID=A0A9W6ZEZ0_9STRA|nr:hypothetical protein TrST_g8568 [Triparma strigata]
MTRILLLLACLCSPYAKALSPAFVGTSKGAFDCSFKASYPRSYKVLKTDKPAPGTGDYNDEFWAQVPWTEDFVDITGNASLTPRFKTAVKIVYDDEYLYFLGKLEEPQVWATLTTDNCVIFNDNDFEIFINPDATTHNYKEIELNAFAHVWDLALNVPYGDGGYENSTRVMDPGFDMLQPSTVATWPTVKSGVTVFPESCINDPSTAPNEGWGVEVRLSLEGIIYNTTSSMPEQGDFWRLDFSRVEWRVLVNETSGEYYKDPAYPNEDNWVWQEIGVVAMHNPDKWGIIQFGGIIGEDDNSVDLYEEWPARQMAMMIYYAEHSFAGANNGTYTTDIQELTKYSPIEGALSSGCGDISVTLPKGGGFVGETTYGGFTALVREDRQLTLK